MPAVSGRAVPAPRKRELPKFAFEPGDLIRFDGIDHVYVEARETGHVMRRASGGMDEFTDHDAFALLAVRRDFDFRRGHFKPGAVVARDRADAETIVQLKPAERDRILWKEGWITGFLRMVAAGEADRTDASMAAAIEALTPAMDALQCARLSQVAVKAKRKRLAAPPAAPASGKPVKPRKRRAGSKVELREPPHPRTLLNWILAAEEGEGKSIALRDAYAKCGNRTLRLAPEVQTEIDRIARTIATEKRKSLTKLHKDLEIALAVINARREAEGQEALPMPSMKPLRKAVKRLPRHFFNAGRLGMPAARKIAQTVAGDFGASRIGERLEMDEWNVQLQTILGRLEIWRGLTAAEKREFSLRLVVNFVIDVATRCVVGVAVGDAATGALAKAAVRMCVADKSTVAAAAGCETPWDMRFLPQWIVNDGGSGLISDEVQIPMRDLGINDIVPPGERPEKRPHVERFHQTVDSSLLAEFTGRTFSNVVEKGDYDPQLRASLTEQAFTKALILWIVDVYHNEPHGGIAWQTPRNRWLQLREEWPPSPPPGADRLREAFGVEVERKVGRKGIRLFGLHYADLELARDVMTSDRRMATIRFDEHDLGAVSLRVGGRWRTLRCRTEGLEGVSMARWLDAARDLRRKHRQQAELTRDVVRRALTAIKGIALDCERDAGLVRIGTAPQEIERLERDLLGAFEIPIPDFEGEDRDPIGSAVSTGCDNVGLPAAETIAPAAGIASAAPKRKRRRPAGSDVVAVPPATPASSTPLPGAPPTGPVASTPSSPAAGTSSRQAVDTWIEE